MAQHFTSANTSVNGNKLPKIFKLAADFLSDTIERKHVNLDFGGGKFDNATEYLAQRGVTNLVYDPFNRSEEHNQKVLEQVKARGGADTITCSNVLNVIDDNVTMYNVINQCAHLVARGGSVFFTVYEGDKSGIGRQTKKDCYQRNKPLSDYYDIIHHYFAVVVMHRGLITARIPCCQVKV